MRSLVCFLLVGFLTFECATCLVHGIQDGRDGDVDMARKEPSSDVGQIQRTGRKDGSSKNDADAMSEVIKLFFPDNELVIVDELNNKCTFAFVRGTT